MATDVLTDLYTQIAVLEFIETIDKCNPQWNQDSPTSYSTSFQNNQDIFFCHLTFMPNDKTVILDVNVNNAPYVSLSSADQSELIDLYNSVVLSINDNIDQDLLNAVSSLPSCRS